jgi:hypothetical protein
VAAGPVLLETLYRQSNTGARVWQPSRAWILFVLRLAVAGILLALAALLVRAVM